MRLPICSWLTTVGQLRSMGARIAPHVADTVTARCTALPTQAEPPDCTITYALDVRIHATIDGGKSKWGVRVDTPV